MSAKTISAFVAIFGGLIVVEHPSTMLRSTWPMQQKAVHVILVFRKPPHAAKIAMLIPLANVDMVFTTERGDEFVSLPCGALWELLGAGEIEPDAFEVVRYSRQYRFSCCQYYDGHHFAIGQGR